MEDLHLISKLPGPEICVHPGLLSIGAAGALGPPAAPLVEALTAAELHSILKVVGAKSRATSKAALAKEVLALVTDHDAVRALVGEAPPAVQEYAHRVARGSIPIQLPWGGGRSEPVGSVVSAPMWLLERGLVYKEAWVSGVMPREVGLALRGGCPFPVHSYQRPQIAVRPVTMPARFAAETGASTVVQAVERLIEAWGSKPAALLKDDGIGVREVRRLAGTIDLPERESFRLIEIAASAGLIVGDTRLRLAMPTTAGDEWLDLGAADRWWALALSWLDTPMYPSLAGAVGVREKTVPALGYPDDYESEAAGQRRSILRAVLDLPEGNGADDEALAQVVQWDAPLHWNDRPAPPSVMVGWTMAEMELLGLMVRGAPTSLASALIGGDLEAVRSLLADPAAGTWQLVLQADLTALVTGQLPSSVRAELEALADVEGAAHPIVLHEDDSFELRPYQHQAAAAFVASGSGVVVLPCGAGKTAVAMAAMASISSRTLVLVTNTVAARQWRAELLAHTSLRDEEIGEYSGERKEIRPVTIATYQIVIKKRGGLNPHMDALSAEDWGLIVYDEVHLLPAPVFRMTADIQSRRRLGLTATLVREDGKEGDVFSLIGPKRFDVPWRDIEAQGYIAPASCTEVRVTLSDQERMSYALAEAQDRYRVGATALSKLAVVQCLCASAQAAGEPTLVIGQYIDQLEVLGRRLRAPVLTGATSTAERERLFAAFRTGEIGLLVVSKVANFSIDLLEATVAIQVSGTFGSRQEEAQRLGRILRPKHDGRQAQFYSVVARDTNDQEFALRRQRFLAEQGYAYRIVDAGDVLVGDLAG